MDVSNYPRATAHNRPRWLQILVVLMLWLSVIPASVHAITGLTFTVITPYAVLDANNCATQGPRAMYIQVDVTNNSGGTLSNLTATFDGFSAAGFTLDTGESPTRYIGTLANGATFPLYYYINYPS